MLIREYKKLDLKWTAIDIAIFVTVIISNFNIVINFVLINIVIFCYYY